MLAEDNIPILVHVKIVFDPNSKMESSATLIETKSFKRTEFGPSLAFTSGDQLCYANTALPHWCM